MSTTIVTINRHEPREESPECGWRRGKFTACVVGVEAIIIVLFGIFLRYEDVAMPNYPKTTTRYDVVGNVTENTTVIGIDQDEKAAREIITHHHIPDNYAMYQDIHVMMFIGFGFLMTFLKRYGFGSVGFNFMLGAICIQWATLTDGWIRRLRHQGNDYYIYVNIGTMINADFAIASALISFGAVLGKVSPLQLLVMGLMEMTLYNTNCLMVYDLLKTNDPGCSLVVHTFGAYFGLAVSKVLHRRDDVEKASSTKESSVYHSDIFAMIGTIFLWTLYPSFNAATAVEEGRIRAIINTYFSLTGSTMMAFAITSLVNKEKFSMVHVQNSTLAGGVAVGTMAEMIIQPWGALLVGCVAGTVSVLGYQFLTPFLRRTFNIHDTCGVHNLHGMPGIIAGLGSILAAGVATTWLYGDGQRKVFVPIEGYTDWTVGQQAGIQAAGLAVSLGMGLLGGTLTGLLMKIPIWDQPRNGEIFNDPDFWTATPDIPGEEPEDQVINLSTSKPSIAITEFTKDI